MNGATSPLPSGERKMLIAIAQHERGVTREQLAILTGFKKTTRNLYLQRLAARDFIWTEGAQIIVTKEGLAALGDFQRLPTGRRLLAHWLQELPDGESRMLKVIAGWFPKALTRDDLDEPLGFKKTTRNLYIQRLAARSLIAAVNGRVVLSRDLAG